MAQIARNGNRAETVLTQQNSIKGALEAYFQKPILSIEKIPGRKKSDNTIKFNDGTHVNFQNKDGDGSGRGWSVDRRDAADHGQDANLQTLLKSVCLRGKTTRPEVDVTISHPLLDGCILGSEDTFKPAFYTHTLSDKTTGVITKISICPTPILMQMLHSELYDKMVPKLTCVHISPSIYLQRKGGGKTDANPDHIQAKFKLNAKIAALFHDLSLIQ
jgi:hypothetical protein